MTNKVRLGIIGLGAQGGFYGKAIADGMVDNMVVSAICDIDPAKEQQAKAMFPDAPFYLDFRAMIDSGDVDGHSVVRVRGSNGCGVTQLHNPFA